jgi:hypothetical protein
VESGAEARAPTRGGDEENRPVCSAVNGRSDNQSCGHSWAHSWGQSGQQTQRNRGPGSRPAIRESCITLIILLRLLLLKIIALKPLEVAQFVKTVSHALLPPRKLVCSRKLSSVPGTRHRCPIPSDALSHRGYLSHHRDRCSHCSRCEQLVARFNQLERI